MGNFKIGEKVVCKDTSIINGIPFGIEKGEIYEIEAIVNCKCSELLLLKGVDSGSLKSCDCSNSLPTNAFRSWRFRKLDYEFAEKLLAEISEAMKSETIKKLTKWNKEQK